MCLRHAKSRARMHNPEPVPYSVPLRRQFVLRSIAVVIGTPGNIRSAAPALRDVPFRRAIS